MEGKLKTWNEDRGFGFIAPTQGGADVFVHIKALPRDGTRPIVGEVLQFDVDTDRDGRKRAVNVRRPGHRLAVARSPRTTGARRSGGNRISTALTAFIVVGLAVYGYQRYEDYSAQTEFAENPPALIDHAVAKTSSNKPEFECDGRTRCSQMRSCKEATYFLQHCPGVEMDGDNDGQPCEQQWCQ